MTGTLDALAYLQGLDILGHATIEDMRHLHHLMFKGVHPWAGQFRGMGQVVMIAGFPAAEPQRIVASWKGRKGQPLNVKYSEFASLARGSEGWPETSNDPSPRMTVSATRIPKHFVNHPIFNI